MAAHARTIHGLQALRLPLKHGVVSAAHCQLDKVFAPLRCGVDVGRAPVAATHKLLLDNSTTL